MFIEILNKIQESIVGVFLQRSLPYSFEIRSLTEPVSLGNPPVSLSPMVLQGTHQDAKHFTQLLGSELMLA